MKHTEEIVDLCGSDYEHYRTGDNAQGQCHIVSCTIGNELGWDDVTLIHTHHSNSPVNRFIHLGQHSDHYAVYVPSEQTVIDYTLAQFAPHVPFPYVGTVTAWLGVLALAWEDSGVLTASTGVECNCL